MQIVAEVRLPGDGVGPPSDRALRDCPNHHREAEVNIRIAISELTMRHGRQALRKAFGRSPKSLAPRLTTIPKQKLGKPEQKPEPGAFEHFASFAAQRRPMLLSHTEGKAQLREPTRFLTMIERIGKHQRTQTRRHIRQALRKAFGQSPKSLAPRLATIPKKGCKNGKQNRLEQRRQNCGLCRIRLGDSGCRYSPFAPVRILSPIR